MTFHLHVGNTHTLTSRSKYLVLQGVSVSARCLSSVRCLSSRSLLCSVAFSMSFSRKDSVTCCHRRLKSSQTVKLRRHRGICMFHESIKLQPSLSWPGFSRPLLLNWPNTLPRDRQLGNVDHPRLSACVAELQNTVPLTLYTTHHRVGGVVLHLRRYPMFGQGHLTLEAEFTNFRWSLTCTLRGLGREDSLM